MINSSLWGQADAIYTLFLLVCLYYLLIYKPLLGVSAFGIAFAIKAQAIFIFPLLIILFFKKRIAWPYFLLVPLIYALFCLPSVLLRRSWLDVFSIYLFQSSFYHDLSRHAPNLYIFMNSFPYDLGVTVGLIVTVVAISCWIWFSAHSKSELSQNAIVLTGLMSVALVPFLLPKMLDRYFYPADIFSLIAAFYLPELWFVPILYQIISASAYLVSLFDASLMLIKVTALLNAATIFFLVWKQVRLLAPISTTQTLTQKSLM
jgi:Gpi18-like mannosyltransferase